MCVCVCVCVCVLITSIPTIWSTPSPDILTVQITSSSPDSHLYLFKDPLPESKFTVNTINVYMLLTRGRLYTRNGLELARPRFQARNYSSLTNRTTGSTIGVAA